MDRAERVAAIRQRLERAADDIETARLDLSAGKFRAATNRAYYTVFHVASAALLWHGQQRRKHAAVEAAFGELLVKPGHVEPEYFRIYRDARRTREQQDYEFTAPPLAEEKAEQVVADCERFVERLTRYLREAGALAEGN